MRLKLKTPSGSSEGVAVRMVDRIHLPYLPDLRPLDLAPAHGGGCCDVVGPVPRSLVIRRGETIRLSFQCASRPTSSNHCRQAKLSWCLIILFFSTLALQKGQISVPATLAAFRRFFSKEPVTVGDGIGADCTATGLRMSDSCFTAAAQGVMTGLVDDVRPVRPKGDADVLERLMNFERVLYIVTSCRWVVAKTAT